MLSSCDSVSHTPLYLYDRQTSANDHRIKHTINMFTMMFSKHASRKIKVKKSMLPINETCISCLIEVKLVAVKRTVMKLR